MTDHENILIHCLLIHYCRWRQNVVCTVEYHNIHVILPLCFNFASVVALMVSLVNGVGRSFLFIYPKSKLSTTWFKCFRVMYLLSSIIYFRKIFVSYGTIPSNSICMMSSGKHLHTSKYASEHSTLLLLMPYVVDNASRTALELSGSSI